METQNNYSTKAKYEIPDFIMLSVLTGKSIYSCFSLHPVYCILLGITMGTIVSILMNTR